MECIELLSKQPFERFCYPAVAPEATGTAQQYYTYYYSYRWVYYSTYYYRYCYCGRKLLQSKPLLL